MPGRGLVSALLTALLLVILVAPASAAPTPRDVLYVGNNWDGTADVINPSPQDQRIGEAGAGRAQVSAGIPANTYWAVPQRVLAGPHPEFVEGGLQRLLDVGVRR